jgi:hypothetical protein
MNTPDRMRTPDDQPGPLGVPGERVLVRAALALYPPAWRARYGDEVRALLAESGGGPRAAASLAWRAMPAWIFPPGHLYDRSARVRASLATVLVAWSMLAGLGLVFAQLVQFQGYRPPGHPIVHWAYLVFDAALALSALVVVVGGLPVWLLMMRRACRQRSWRDIAYLLLPAVAPAAYLLALLVTLRLVRGADGISPWWFPPVTLTGFVAAAIAAAGPALALRRMRPAGPALRLAAGAACLATATMAVAAIAITVAVISLSFWSPDFPGYHGSTGIGIYLTLVATAATITVVSASRGARSAFPATSPAPLDL